MGGVKSSARSGSAGLATPASCLLKSPHALRVPEYRLVLWVGSVPTPRVIMQAVFPGRQGTPCGDMIASGKFSQPERLPAREPGRAERIAPPPRNGLHATAQIPPVHVYRKPAHGFGVLLFSAGA